MDNNGGTLIKKTNIVIPVIVKKQDIKSGGFYECMAEITITFKGFEVSNEKTTLGIESLCKAIDAKWEDPVKVKKTEDDKYFIEKPDSDQIDYLKDIADTLHNMGVKSVERTETGIVMNCELEEHKEEVPY